MCERFHDRYLVCDTTKFQKITSYSRNKSWGRFFTKQLHLAQTPSHVSFRGRRGHHTRNKGSDEGTQAAEPQDPAYPGFSIIGLTTTHSTADCNRSVHEFEDDTVHDGNLENI